MQQVSTISSSVPKYQSSYGAFGKDFVHPQTHTSKGGDMPTQHILCENVTKKMHRDQSIFPRARP